MVAAVEVARVVEGRGRVGEVEAVVRGGVRAAGRLRCTDRASWRRRGCRRRWRWRW